MKITHSYTIPLPFSLQFLRPNVPYLGFPEFSSLLPVTTVIIQIVQTEPTSEGPRNSPCPESASQKEEKQSNKSDQKAERNRRWWVEWFRTIIGISTRRCRRRTDAPCGWLDGHGVQARSGRVTSWRLGREEKSVCLREIDVCVQRVSNAWES